MDVSDDEEEQNEEESEVEESEETESETESDSESDSESMSMSESEEDEISVKDVIESSAKYDLKIFTEETITSFKLDVFREYLHFRCNPNEFEMEQMEIDQDEDSDLLLNDNEEQPILPKYEYSLNDEIWDKLNNIRSYITLPIEYKLEILGILFKDAMSTKIVQNWMNERIQKYQDIKNDIKLLDDEHSNMVKEEKNKMKKIRNEISQKKRILNPKKSGSSNSASSSSSSSSRSNSSSPNKENNATKSNSNSLDAINGEKKTATSRQQILRKKKEEKEKEKVLENEERQKLALKRDIEKLDKSLKAVRNLFDEKCRLKEIEITYKKFKMLRKCRTYLMELGSDRFHNKYFWSLYSDGRIFIFHSNPIYHQLMKNKNESITKQIMKSKKDEIKMYNKWEEMADDEKSNTFCWSFISSSTEFYELLNVLDVRGVRESQLLLTLNALKNDIIRTMRMIGNDDYKEPIMAMDVDENEKTEDIAPKQLRRSTRAKKGSISNENNQYIQSANKDFTSYRNKIKRK